MVDTVRVQSDLAQAAAPGAGATTGTAFQSFPLRRLWWAAILLLGLSVGAVGWTIWQLRSDAIRSAVADSGNIAAVLAGQLSRSIQEIDVVLLDIRRGSNDLDINDRSKFRAAYNRKDVRDLLVKRLIQLPQVFNVAIADDSGQVVVTTATWPTPDINLADRDYFQRARTRTDGQLSTSVPVKNRIDGTDTIVFARRLERSDGTFAGIVFASVNTKYFESIYGSTQSVRSLIFNLIREDGIILFRHPDTLGSTGRRLSAESAWQDTVSKGAKGFRILAKEDGNVRYVSVQPVPGYPLFVNISVTEAAALAGWYQRSITIGLGSAILLLCTIYLLLAITRQVRRLSESEAALRESKQVVGAILNTVPARIFWKDKNLAYLGCNAAFARDAGFAHPEDVVGKDDYQMGWREQADLYRGDDRQVIESGRDKLLIEEPQTTPEGKVITLLTSKIPLRNLNGEVSGVLGTYMDVTERARLEKQLRTANDKIEKQNVQFDAALNNMAQGLSDVRSRRASSSFPIGALQNCSEYPGRSGKSQQRARRFLRQCSFPMS